MIWKTNKQTKKEKAAILQAQPSASFPRQARPQAPPICSIYQYLSTAFFVFNAT